MKLILCPVALPLSTCSAARHAHSSSARVAAAVAMTSSSGTLRHVTQSARAAMRGHGSNAPPLLGNYHSHAHTPRILHPAVLAICCGPMLTVQVDFSFSNDVKAPASSAIASTHALAQAQEDTQTLKCNGQVVTAELPEDAKGRPYPYVQPPAYAGTYPTVCFHGGLCDAVNQ